LFKLVFSCSLYFNCVCEICTLFIVRANRSYKADVSAIVRDPAPDFVQVVLAVACTTNLHTDYHEVAQYSKIYVPVCTERSGERSGGPQPHV
jgi:hypothetical protein